MEDDGIGMSAETLEQLRTQLAHLPEEMPEKHIGLLNVAIRLHLMYPSSPPVSVESAADVFTRFALSIPLESPDPATASEDA